MTETIQQSQIKYSPNSLCDQVGRVFFWNGRVFREINKTAEQEVRDLLSSELFEILTAKHYIPETKIADCKIEGKDTLILEHERIQPSSPSDWSFSMLKDAAIFLLKLNSLLKKHGYNLWDGHLANVCFYHNHPMLVDFGSIASQSRGSWFDGEFIRTCCYPLILFTENERFLAKTILSARPQRTLPLQTINKSELIKKCFKRFFGHIHLRYWLRNSQKLERKLLQSQFLQKHIHEKFLEKTMWQNYQDDLFDNIEKGNVSNKYQRYEKIKNFIQVYCSDATSVTDLAGNRGGMCYYLEHHMPQLQNLVSIDYDETAIEVSYNYFKNHDTKLNLILGNFMVPIRSDFAQGFRSDVAIAMAVTHHLILTQGFHISAIFEAIKSFSKKYVFIEFMPLGLWGGGEKNQWFLNGTRWSGFSNLLSNILHCFIPNNWKKTKYYL